MHFFAFVQNKTVCLLAVSQDVGYVFDFFVVDLKARRWARRKKAQYGLTLKRLLLMSFISIGETRLTTTWKNELNSRKDRPFSILDLKHSAVNI